MYKWEKQLWSDCILLNSKTIICLLKDNNYLSAQPVALISNTFLTYRRFRAIYRLCLSAIFASLI